MTIRTRILLVFVIVIGGGFYFLVQWIAGDLRPRYLESLEEPLVDMAHFLAEAVADEFTVTANGTVFNPRRLTQIIQKTYQRRFNAHIYALHKQQVDMRIYVTDDKGTVLFDSEQQAVGQDYSQWNDVYLTLAGRYGARATAEDPAHPHSVTLYIAAPIYLQDRLVGVITVGKPAHHVDRFIALAKSQLMIAGCIAAAIVIVISSILYLWVSLPLQRLVHYARVVQSNKRIALPQLGRNELGAMANAIEEMRVALAGKEYIENYVQTLTHELKSPLSAIRGAAELLAENPPEAIRQRFLAHIHTETQRIRDVVDRLLELAALEKRQGLEHTERLNIIELVEAVVNQQLPLATVKKVTVAVHVMSTANQLLELTGERFLVQQAINNLLCNALEFSPANSSIDINLALCEHTINKKIHRGVEIVIRDQGVGIPDYAMNKIFDRFYSLPRPNGSKGTGLGLSFVKEIVQLHGGTITVGNHFKQGVIARLWLPNIDERLNSD